MTAAELATVLATVIPGVIALAKIYRQTDQVRKLEEIRQPNGKRIGDIESRVDNLAGQVAQLTLVVHGRAGDPVIGARPRPMGEPVLR